MLIGQGHLSLFRHTPRQDRYELPGPARARKAPKPTTSAPYSHPLGLGVAPQAEPPRSPQRRLGPTMRPCAPGTTTASTASPRTPSDGPAGPPARRGPLRADRPAASGAGHAPAATHHRSEGTPPRAPSLAHAAAGRCRCPRPRPGPATTNLGTGHRQDHEDTRARITGQALSPERDTPGRPPSLRHSQKIGVRNRAEATAYRLRANPAR